MISSRALCLSLVAIAPWLFPIRQSEAQSPSTTQASSPNAPASNAAAPYTFVRYDEDYSYLADPGKRTDFWDPIKYIPLGPQDWYATFGGETRQRYESYTHYPFAPQLQTTHGYYLQRYMLDADIHLGENIRFFGQLKSALVDDKNVVSPVDLDRGDVNQAFVDLRFPLKAWDGSNNDSLTFRLGRQELDYGSGRLITVREGPNDRQSFDGGKLMLRAGDWKVDGFVVQQVNDKPGYFDNRDIGGQLLYGIYATSPVSFPSSWPLSGGTHGVDLYAIGFRRDNAVFSQGTATEERYSVGSRLFGATQGWDYDAEGIYQFGRLGSGNIQAYYAGAIIGYTFAGAPFTPRLSLGADVASGDQSPGSHNLQTFDPMYPRGNYYDEASLITISNVYALHPGVDLHLLPNLTLTTDSVILWRQSAGDGIYAPNMLPLLGSSAPGGKNAGRYIGVQPTVQIGWQIDRHLSLTASYSHLFSGEYVRSAAPPGAGREVDFIAAWVSYKF